MLATVSTDEPGLVIDFAVERARVKSFKRSKSGSSAASAISVEANDVHVDADDCCDIRIVLNARYVLANYSGLNISVISHASPVSFTSSSSHPSAYGDDNRLRIERRCDAVSSIYDITRQAFGLDPKEANEAPSSAPASTPPRGVNISAIQLCDSSFDCVLGRACVGSPVYVDTDVYWHYLPPHLDECTSISLALVDRIHQRRDFLSFTLPSDQQKCIVFLAFDSRLPVLPDWVNANGFAPTSDCLVARKRRSDLTKSPKDLTFVPYGRCFDAGSQVEIPGASSFNENLYSMYYVVVVPLARLAENPSRSTALDQMAYHLAASALDQFEEHGDDGSNGQHTFSHTAFKSLVREAWIRGSSGFTLFGSCNGKARICIRRPDQVESDLGNAASPPSYPLRSTSVKSSPTLSAPIDLSTRGLHFNTPFDVSSPHDAVTYRLALRAIGLPGPFKKTRVLSVMPRLIIANCTSTPLALVPVFASTKWAVKAAHVQVIQPYKVSPMHAPDDPKLKCSVFDKEGMPVRLSFVPGNNLEAFSSGMVDLDQVKN